jgi:hypothetical protein
MEEIVERWLPVVDYEGIYEVSDQGNVRSLNRHRTDSLGRSFKMKGKMMKQSDNGKGYRILGLSVGSKVTYCYVHRLVARAFIGMPPEGCDVCHNNGDKADNRLANLRYDSRSNNHLDKVQHGTMRQGSKHHWSRLNEGQVVEIQDLLMAGVSQAEIARRYGVTPIVIFSINHGRTWKHVKRRRSSP